MKSWTLEDIIDINSIQKSSLYKNSNLRGKLHLPKRMGQSIDIGVRVAYAERDLQV